jgi:large repetitive protein
MPLSLRVKAKQLLVCISLFLLFQQLPLVSHAQMRQAYFDNVSADNDIRKISFYTPTEGYVAFRDWIGYTTDTGKTFTKKYITNVNLNGYSVNLTFGFQIAGVKAFNQNTIIAYGDYGLVPAILYSSDGGNSFKLVFHSQYIAGQWRTGITDMIFPTNGSIGYAVDADRIIKTTNQGQSWSVINASYPGSYFDFIEAVDDNNVFVGSSDDTGNKLLKTTNSGSTWQRITLPAGYMRYASFVTTSNGWVSIVGFDSQGYTYATTNGGGSWTLQNDAVSSFASRKMKFIDNNTGFALGGLFSVFKTVNGGKVWEQLPRDNSFTYLGYSHNALQVLNSNQFWAGGGYGFLELSTNGGGTPKPAAFFKVDTTGYLSNGGIVNLKNYSRSDYTYQWYVNGSFVGSGYNATYTHDVNHLNDTVRLEVSNGTTTGESIQYPPFFPPVIVSSFTPVSAAPGTAVTITGQNFTGATSVTFGGVKASSFTVISATTITATVGAGASGAVTVTTLQGKGTLAGFSLIPPPTVTAFTPTSAKYGTAITITGTDFSTATMVRMGGVSATFTVVSNTEITAVAPSGGSGTVEVTTTGGTAFKDGYIALPQINSFTPNNGTLGTVLKITGTSFTGITAITVGGVNVQSFTINSSTSISAVVSTGASGDVVITKTGGSASKPGFGWFPPPVITSFTPVSGPVGTTVVITGSNFNPIPTSNTVYFGGMKAAITAGSATSLTVTVPAGAIYDAISVTSNLLSAYSMERFIVTFPDGGTVTPNSFANRSEWTATGYTPLDMALGDLDGDGKTDIAFTNRGQYTNQNAVSIVRNTSTTTTVSFDPKIDFLINDPASVAISDIDGDGKLDFAATNISDGTVSIFRNTGSPGAMSFAVPVVLKASGANGIVIGDIDGDGKPDIALSGGGVNVFRNLSDSGYIDFAKPVTFSVGGGIIVSNDLNRDGKPDLFTTSWNSNNIAIMTNNSTKGTIAFAATINQAANAPYYIAAGDIDGDGKPDIAYTDITGSKASVLLNTGTAGAITFTAGGSFNAGSSPTSIALADLDGDGKLDMGVSQIDFNLSVFKNTSSMGTVSFSAKQDYGGGDWRGENIIVIGDINGDGRPDPIVTAELRRAASIFINNVKPEPFINSFTPTVAGAGTTITITGNNFTGTTAVSFGGVPAASFTVNSATSITAVVGNGGPGNVSVTNAYGTGTQPGFAYGIPPVITLVTPATGAVGAAVTITGSGFDATPAGNIVYFGGVKAVVTSAAANSITVTVPAGISNLPVTVTANNLTAYTNAFTYTFPGATGSFTAANFGTRIDKSKGGNSITADMDGDGKPDLVWPGMGIARNTSSNGVISFAANVNFTTSTNPYRIALGDLDGDGKPDAVVSNTSLYSISLLRNTSTPGNLSFAPQIDYPCGPNSAASDVVIKDLDLDGRPDILLVSYSSHTVSIFRNQSAPGTLSFENRFDYGVEGYPQDISVDDIDGDGKPEIVIVQVYGSNIVSVFRNTSAIGAISFAPKQNLSGVNSSATRLVTTDIDGDGKIDIITANGFSNNISAFRNTSTPGNISFGTSQQWASGSGVYDVCVGDLDGDGKTDVAAYHLDVAYVAVFKNISTSGTIALADKYAYGTIGGATTGAIADMDNDGAPDIVVAGGTISIFRNQLGGVMQVSLCANGTTNLTSNITGSSYQWQQNTGSGYINISDNSNFSGTNAATLQLNAVPAAWNGYKFRCVVNGTQNSNAFMLAINTATVTPSVTIATPNTTICTGTSVTFTATPTNAGAAPQYQWQVNGNNVGTNTPAYTSAGLTNGDQVKVILTNTDACASLNPATSNTIAMVVNAIIQPSVTIAQSPDSICAGAPVIFIATAANGGSAPVFQWRKNSVNTGTNSASYTDNTLKSGDTINVILTSNAACALPGTISSNTIRILVKQSITPSISISGNTSLNNGAATLLTSAVVNDGAAVAYQWQDSTSAHSWQNITGATGASFSYTPALSGDKVRCTVTGNITCAGQQTAISEALTFTVVSGGRITPNPVNDVLTISNLQTSDDWETVEIVNMNGGNKVMTVNVVNQTSISVNVGGLPGGMYVAVLKSRSGATLQLKFMKL